MRVVTKKLDGRLLVESAYQQVYQAERTGFTVERIELTSAEHAAITENLPGPIRYLHGRPVVIV